MVNYLTEQFETDGRLVVCDISDIAAGHIFSVKPGMYQVSYEKETEDDEYISGKQFIKWLSVRNCSVLEEEDCEEEHCKVRKTELFIDSGQIGILEFSTFNKIPKNDADFCEECDLLSCQLVKNPDYKEFHFDGNADEDKFGYYEAKSKYIENRKLSQEFLIKITPSIIRGRGVVTSNCCDEAKYPVRVYENTTGEIVGLEVVFTNGQH